MVEEIIKNYVNKKDKESLYLILSDYLKESFERFDENIKYVEKNSVLEEELSKIDLNSLTPLEALNALFELKKKI